MLMGLSRNNLIKYKYKSVARKIYFYLVFALSLCLSFLFLLQLRDAFLKVFIPYAINIGSDSINYTVADYFEKNYYSYDDFVTLSYNAENEITSLQTNTSLMNKVKADLSIYLQEYVNELKGEDVWVPLGSVLNNPIFSGIGPNIKITVKPTDITDLVFSDSFEDVGINQVRHKIYIEAFINISIHCASMSKTEIIEDTILVAETVIVGRVPKYYSDDGLNISTKSEEE